MGKEAVDVLGVVISEFPPGTLSNTNDVAGLYLKHAMMLRADWNLLMGNDDQCIADFENILSYLPSDVDARIQLAHALNDAKIDTEQALSVMAQVLEKRPKTPPDTRSYMLAAQDAGVFAASRGKHDIAQQYFEVFRKYLCDLKPKKYKYVQVYTKKTSEEMKRYSQGVFYEMVNGLIAGDAERVTA